MFLIINRKVYSIDIAVIFKKLLAFHKQLFLLSKITDIQLKILLQSISSSRIRGPGRPQTFMTPLDLLRSIHQLALHSGPTSAAKPARLVFTPPATWPTPECPQSPRPHGKARWRVSSLSSRCSLESKWHRSPQFNFTTDRSAAMTSIKPFKPMDEKFPFDCQLAIARRLSCSSTSSPMKPASWTLSGQLPGS